MNEAVIQDEVEFDLRYSPTQTVIYLEGVTDVESLFALLGIPTPRSDSNQIVLFQGVMVKGCARRGSGSTAVRARVEVGKKLTQQGLVYGVVDGDGRSLETLAPDFDPPHQGPLFAWKAYCIENLLAKTGWPPAWGDEPVWTAELSAYAPYVALNRVGLQVRSLLERLNLMNYVNPSGTLKSDSEFGSVLTAGKDQLQSYDVHRRFEEELAAFREMARSRLDEAHCLMNGKWLVDHLAPRLSGRHNAQKCKSEWLAHAVAVGGLPEVRDWWERVTGFAP